MKIRKGEEEKKRKKKKMVGGGRSIYAPQCAAKISKIRLVFLDSLEIHAKFASLDTRSGIYTQTGNSDSLSRCFKDPKSLRIERIAPCESKIASNFRGSLASRRPSSLLH